MTNKKIMSPQKKGETAVGKIGIVKEFWEFLKVRKKWWLTPIVIVLLLLGFLIVFTQGSALSPFVYTLF
jgi:hypothetical protein